MIFLYMLLFVLWTVFGSFGGVIIERGSDGFSRDGWKEVFWGRSYCPWCDGKTLVWWQLIPLVGRLMQKGKCFRCKQPIPGWYCLIELVMGLVFVVTWRWVVWSVGELTQVYLIRQLILWCLINRALVLILIADLRYYELNVYVWVILLGLWLLNLVLGVIYNEVVWQPVLIGTVILTLLFLGIYLSARRYATKKAWQPTEGFGFGDVMMAGALGLLLHPVLESMASVDWIIAIQWLLTYLVLSSILGIGYWAVRNVIVPKASQVLPFLPAMIVSYWLMIAASGMLHRLFLWI